MRSVLKHWLVQGVIAGVLANAAYALLRGAFSESTLSGVSKYGAILSSPVSVPAWICILLLFLMFALLVKVIRTHWAMTTRYKPSPLEHLIIKTIRINDAPAEHGRLVRWLAQNSPAEYGARDSELALEHLAELGWLETSDGRFAPLTYALGEPALEYARNQGIHPHKQDAQPAIR